MIGDQLCLPALDPGNLGLQLLDLVYLPLPAVLCSNLARRVCFPGSPYNTGGSYLVLPSPPDVSAEGELLLGELVLGEQVVELVHWKVYDF